MLFAYFRELRSEIEKYWWTPSASFTRLDKLCSFPRTLVWNWEGLMNTFHRLYSTWCSSLISENFVLKLRSIDEHLLPPLLDLINFAHFRELRSEIGKYWWTPSASFTALDALRLFPRTSVWNWEVLMNTFCLLYSTWCSSFISENFSLKLRSFDAHLLPPLLDLMLFAYFRELLSEIGKHWWTPSAASTWLDALCLFPRKHFQVQMQNLAFERVERVFAAQVPRLLTVISRCILSRDLKISHLSSCFLANWLLLTRHRSTAFAFPFDMTLFLYRTFLLLFYKYFYLA